MIRIINQNTYMKPVSGDQRKKLGKRKKLEIKIPRQKMKTGKRKEIGWMIGGERSVNYGVDVQK